MANTTLPPNPALPPDANELERQEYNRWFDGAVNLVRASELAGGYESFRAIMDSEAFVRLSAMREGGYPSPVAFAALAPSMRKLRLTELVQDAGDVQRDILGFLHNIPKDNARKLIGQLMMGRPTAEFYEQLEDLQHDLLLTVESPPLAQGKIEPDDTPEPGRPGRRPKKVARMGQNPGDDIFITEKKS